MCRQESYPKNPPRRTGRPRDGFTLIELLVVVAIIGILASILLPSLARTKSQAQGILCQNNTRQLGLASAMYCDDNRGFYPYNMAGNSVHTNINWAEDVLDWDTTPDNTNTALLTDAALGPFTVQTPALYHCPSDSVLSSIQSGLGWHNRARSYSMNASIGNAGDITQSGVNTNNPDYVQFFKSTLVPAPSRIFVFMEEHPDTISDGYFLNKAYYHRWIRLPASYHNGCANISFADGHAELHAWLDADTKAPSIPDGADPVVYTNLPPTEQNDYVWVITHMTVRQH